MCYKHYFLWIKILIKVAWGKLTIFEFCNISFYFISCVNLINFNSKNEIKTYVSKKQKQKQNKKNKKTKRVKNKSCSYYSHHSLLFIEKDSVPVPSNKSWCWAKSIWRQDEKRWIHHFHKGGGLVCRYTSKTVDTEKFMA